MPTGNSAWNIPVAAVSESRSAASLTSDSIGHDGPYEMSNTRNSRWRISPGIRKWLFLPPVLIGVLVLAVTVIRQQGVRPEPEAEVSRVLRVIDVPKVEFVPRVLGYGTAQPGRIWQAVAEVKGRVVEVHPNLTSGMVVRAGTELLKIDPVEYELAVARLDADIEQTKAQFAELQARETNYRASLTIEEQSLRLAEQELARQRKLLVQNAAAMGQVESTERTVLAQRQSVQAQRSALNLMPAERNSLQAALAAKTASLASAKRDLQNAVIKAPFDSRLGQVTIEKGQFLGVGQALFEAHGTDSTEVEVQVPVGKLGILLDFDSADRARFIEAIVAMDIAGIREMLRIDAIVRLQSGQLNASWEGRGESTREFVDPQTRTLGVVVVVDRPYEKVIPGQRPPLVKGMFCEVEMRGKPQPDRVVIPRTAIYNGHVYLVDKENRLHRRKVEVAFGQASLAVIASGLSGGEKLIVSDPTPAIEGMLVKPEADLNLQQELIAVAVGKGDLK